MSEFNKLNKGKLLVHFYQTMLNSSLIILSCVLILFLFKELYNIVTIAIIGKCTLYTWQSFGVFLVFWIYFDDCKIFQGKLSFSTKVSSLYWNYSKYSFYHC